MICIYRNLGRSTKTKTIWSIVASTKTKQGFATKGKGPKHFETGLMMRDICTNNPQTHRTGCARILKNIANPNTSATREVVAWVAGDVSKSDPKDFDCKTRLGVLTLDLNAGAFVIRADNGSLTAFNPRRMPETLCLTFNQTCEVWA